MQGINFLRKKLRQKSVRVELRYKYYDMKNALVDFGISTPPSLMGQNSPLGWCSKAVDSISNRLVFREFRNDTFDINEIYKLNNPDILFDSAIHSALVGSCGFIYISADENGFPRLQALSGDMATGIIDPITGLLKEGYAILEKETETLGIIPEESSPKQEKIEAYFTPEYTDYYKHGKFWKRYDNPTNIPLLVPIIFRPDAKRLFGHSRISRACMGAVQSAMRTVKRSEIAAEFYSFPQKYVVGTDPEMDPLDKWKATMSSMMEFTKDADGDHPTLGQFQQQSMGPHLEQFRMFAGVFAGETGLTMDDLGFPSENPASQEAIKASHENLRLTAKKASKTFGSGFLNAGFVAACLRDETPYLRNELYETIPIWEPIFEPDAAMLSLIGDGAIKLNQAVPGYFATDNLRDLTGIEKSQKQTPLPEVEP